MVAIYPTGGDCGISGGGTDEDGWGGQSVCVCGGGGGGGIPNFTPLGHHQQDFCIRMGMQGREPF